MQDVSFQIVNVLRDNWFPIINEIERHGYAVEYEPVKARTTVILSGTYFNPFYIKGKRILLAYKEEWGPLWKEFYKPILEEYYDEVIIMNDISLKRLIEKIGGDCEVTEPRSKD